MLLNIQISYTNPPKYDTQIFQNIQVLNIRSQVTDILKDEVTQDDTIHPKSKLPEHAATSLHD